MSGLTDPTAPLRRTPSENHATLLISWWCTLCALFLILLRVFGRLSRTGTWYTEDKFMALAIIPLLIRMGCVHVVLLYGTNNTTVPGLTAEEIQHREIGARLVLAARIFYAMFIWVSKLTVSEFVKRLTTSTWNRKSEIILQGIRVFLLLTFFGVVIATLAECQPFDHYWQVVPDPGPRCRTGFAQLLTMGASDIITDIVLILFPTAVIARSTMPLKRKISTIALYSLGAILIAIAAYRIPAIIAVHGRQQRRSLWASIEILASAAAANAVIIGSFVRDRGAKKQRYRPETARSESAAEVPSFNRSLTRQHWGNDSDEDLFRSMGGRMDSVTKIEGPTLAGQVESYPMMNSGFEHPYEDIEDEASSHEKGRRNGKAHASESLSLADYGGLLPVSSGLVGTSQAHQTAAGSSAFDFARPLARESQTSRSSDARSDNAALIRALEDTGPRQTLPPNGRPVMPGSEFDLQDAGGLLR